MYAFPFHLADLVSCGKPPPVLNAQDWYHFTSIGTKVTYCAIQATPCLGQHEELARQMGGGTE